MRDQADPRLVRRPPPPSAAKAAAVGAGVEVDQRPGVRGGRDQGARELGRVRRAVVGEDHEEELHRGRRLPSDIGNGHSGLGAGPA